MRYDLRSQVKALERQGLLHRVRSEVDKNWELSAIIRWVYQGYEEAKRYAVLFERVKGYEFPVVVGVTGASYKTYAVALGIAPNRPRTEVMREVRQKFIEALILKHLQDLGFEEVADINIPEGAQVGVVIVSIRKQDAGQPARIAQAIFSLLQPRWGKFLIVTDDDVNIYDLDNVFWAITFRTSLSPARRNIHFLEGMIAQILDYSAANAIEDLKSRWDWPSAGVLIDATRPYAPYPVVSLPPSRYLIRALESWNQYGLPELDRKEVPQCLVVEEDYLKKGLAALPRFMPLTVAK